MAFASNIAPNYVKINSTILRHRPVLTGHQQYIATCRHELLYDKERLRSNYDARTFQKPHHVNNKLLNVALQQQCLEQHKLQNTKSA